MPSGDFPPRGASPTQDQQSLLTLGGPGPEETASASTRSAGTLLESVDSAVIEGQALPRPGVFPTDKAPTAAPRALLAPLRSALASASKLGLVMLLAYGLMFNFSVVRGSSMAPGIHDGDRILVDHLSFLFQGVRRGDIVVLQYPLDPAVDYIKRVIGLPGDEVLIEGGRVYVNGGLLDEPYVETRGGGIPSRVTVLPEHYFVLGDNRPHSSDSREFGQVHRELLRGRVDVRLWPFDRAGRID
jgi:signal peptidase I